MPFLYFDILVEEGEAIKSASFIDKEETANCYPFTYGSAGKEFNNHKVGIPEHTLVTALEVSGKTIKSCWEVAKERAPVLTGISLNKLLFGAVILKSDLEDHLSQLEGDLRLVDEDKFHYKVFKLGKEEKFFKEMII
jgi:hypothetical protein